MAVLPAYQLSGLRVPHQGFFPHELLNLNEIFGQRLDSRLTSSTTILTSAGSFALAI